MTNRDLHKKKRTTRQWSVVRYQMYSRSECQMSKVRGQRFGFTLLGSGLSDDYEDGWPGRYLIEEYYLLYISAFPSIATKLTDKLSVAASLALTYTRYEQEKAVKKPGPGFR